MLTLSRYWSMAFWMVVKGQFLSKIYLVILIVHQRAFYCPINMVSTG